MFPSRQNQVQAARARLASRGVPAGAQAGNVAGCGPGGWGCAPPPGAPPGPYGPAPLLPAEAVMNMNGVLPQYMVPCWIRFQVDGDTTAEVSPTGGAQMYGCGVRSLNLPGEVQFQLTPGQLQIPLFPCGPVDSSLYTTDECYCPLPIGCFSNVSPLVVEASPIGTQTVPPFLNIAIFGTVLRAAGCGPWVPWGFPGGGFPGNGGGGMTGVGGFSGGGGGTPPTFPTP